MQNNPCTLLYISSVLVSDYFQNPWQFSSVLLGGFSNKAIRKFWEHVKTLEEFKHHRELHELSSEDLGVTIPCTIHGDGAEMFTNEEFFVWSWSSAFTGFGSVKDPLIQKIPIAIVAERDMMLLAVSLLSPVSIF